jgi:hypothetical protein
MGVVFDTPAIDGLTSVGELFSGKATFASEGIAALLKMVIGTTEYEELWSSVVDIFSLAGINESLSDFLNDAYEKIHISNFSFLDRDFLSSGAYVGSWFIT